MDTIVTTAVVGTGQQSKPAITTGTSIDALVARLPDGNIERKLLLAAGSLAVYRQAGQIAAQAPSAPEPAAPETLLPCSAHVAQILTGLYQSKDHEILSEAYMLLEKAHLRLPYELLPHALLHATQNQPMRTRLLPVLGERGYWLSQFNPAWSWVAQLRLGELPMLPSDSETNWHDGTVGQRTEILRRVRATDPAQALAWLTAVWKQEKAEARAAFLATLEIGLSMQDQPFLARALNDRSESVCAMAASLMLRLSAAPQTQRLLARADTLLHCTNGKLIVVLPGSIDEEWIHDVTMSRISMHTSAFLSYWLVQTIARVPPAHWEERFSAMPAQLLEAINESEWCLEVVNALVQAALLHNNSAWFSPLLDWQEQKMATDNIDRQQIASYPALLARVPQREAENRVRRLLSYQDYWVPSLRALPTPWSKEFSADALQVLKNYYYSLDKNTYVADNWDYILDTFAASLAPSCFNAAAIGWDHFVANGNGFVPYWNTRLHAFLQRISIRKSLMEEIL